MATLLVNESGGVKSLSAWTSTRALEQELHILKDRSASLSASLTQQLATSESGQNLLHLGGSLSTLPPDLHSLIAHLKPLVEEVEGYEEKCRVELHRIEECGTEIEAYASKSRNARECAAMYEDLVAAEEHAKSIGGEGSKVDEAAALERAALTTLYLVQELQSSLVSLGSSPGLSLVGAEDTDKAQFLMKLSPRIRTLESDTIKGLVHALEALLRGMRPDDNDRSENVKTEYLQPIAHCLRGLALLGRSSMAESTFATIAIMPIIRSKLSLGRLDEGGSRGQCAGLFSLLDDIACSISSAYGPILAVSEAMFNTHDILGSSDSIQLDLLTAGVWVPIATALLADPAIKMAIFSPGIASILQANYSAIDVFLSELSQTLLKSNTAKAPQQAPLNPYSTPLLPTATITPQTIDSAQKRIYKHPITRDFYNKWNLPIYYQLRFQEATARLNKAIVQVQAQGWLAPVFTNTDAAAQLIHEQQAFELPIFQELYDILLTLFKPHVFLSPLTHRFLRGALQLISRLLAFVHDGLHQNIKFSESTDPQQPSPNSYYWAERVEDIATVAWELTLLQTAITHHYPNTILTTLTPQTDNLQSLQSLQSLITDLFAEASTEIPPLIHKSWNELIVDILIAECSAPLSAVKGVAATYRMTNRPPPTQPSPFVSTILKPLKIFTDNFETRIPVDQRWKHTVIATVSDRYSLAVEELIETVKRTEVALKNRKSRMTTTSGGMSDGDKVRLQLLLDYKEFAASVEELGVGLDSCDGLKKLKSLTNVVDD